MMVILQLGQRHSHSALKRILVSRENLMDQAKRAASESSQHHVWKGQQQQERKQQQGQQQEKQQQLQKQEPQQSNNPQLEMSIKSAIVDYYNKSDKCIKQRAKLTTNELVKVKTSQKYVNPQNIRRRDQEKMSIYSYLNVCIDVGQINRAFNTLLKLSDRGKRNSSLVDVDHYNVVLKGWAKLGSVAQMVETRMHMAKNNIEPNTESYAYILLAYTNSDDNRKNNVKRVIEDMKVRGIDAAFLFHYTYLNPDERRSIRRILKQCDPDYEEIFCDIPINYNCKLLENFDKTETEQYDFNDNTNFYKLTSLAREQERIENESSIVIKSVTKIKGCPMQFERYSKLWAELNDMWRKSLSEALDQSLEVLQNQSEDPEKIHLYPYLCSVDKDLVVKLMLDEIEINALYSSFSESTLTLHYNIGKKFMTRYQRAKAIKEGSHQERQKIYSEYLRKYLTNPALMAQMNPRQFFQNEAADTKNYAVYKDMLTRTLDWPHHVVAAVGKLLYGLILREVKFDPKVLNNPNREINKNNLVHAFYTAYFQVECSHKIKEEFRSHQYFELLFGKISISKLRFDYSFLPCASPPLPWISKYFGGYLSNNSSLVRINPFSGQLYSTLFQITDNQKLYPSLDSLNAIGLCPWIVNQEILDIVIKLFESGGDLKLNVPLEQVKVDDSMPVLKDNSSKADRILYNREKKRFDKRKREMYALWIDCLYRLSIANHYRDKVFWFPHNMDFRGRTYPIPPHFNHLGADLARALLLFSKGKPLGDKGLDWLKLHVINLVGRMKSSSLSERLEYANSILHSDILDSADNPWDGRRWWTKNENPWQVLACCKEIAKAIRSRDFRLYISHFPIHQDGSCNGLQHYAALGRDPSGATAVNLVPSERPQDVYSRVVEIVESMRKQDAEAGVKLACMLDGFIQRKVIKQTVMTTVYGVTRYGARTQIARQLAAKGYNEDQIWQAAHYLTTKTFESIGQMFQKSRLIQDWFNDCAFMIAARCKHPVSWETPLGFTVTQPYALPHSLVKTRLLGQTVDTGTSVGYDPMVRINPSKQKTAFPPNFIHSLDSSHMMLTSLYCQRQGITFVSVHDCYWTHPSTVDKMNKICRQQFITLHSEPLLRDLSEQFIAKYGGLIEHKPAAGSKTLIDVLEDSKHVKKIKSRAVFEDVPTTGNLDLNQIRDSVYFFS